MAKKKFVSVLLVLLVLTAITLASCVAVEVVGIAITEDSEYKTEYLIGEELDITGIKLNVTRSDGREYMVFATDVRDDLRILNFSTTREQEDLAVIIEYKEQTTSFTIDVKASDAAMRRYTVTFDTGYGSKVESASVPEYGKVAAPESPTRDGYAFDGWYKEATFNNQFNFSTEIITSDTTLYAKWSKLYYITFLVEGSEPIVKSVKEGATLTDVPVVPPVEGMTGTWDRSTFTNIRTDITVNAIYTVQTFTVNFYYTQPGATGLILIGSFENIPYGCNFAEEYSAQIAALDVPKELPDNHTHFVGWDQTFESVKSDLEITAVYATNKYDVTFDLNYTPEDGSSVYHVAEDITYDAIVSAPAAAPEREGYEFDGWYRQPSCTTAWDFNNSRVEGDTTLYAKWVRLYTVSFLVSADIELDEELTEFVEYEGKRYGVYLRYSVRYGGAVNRPEAPAKAGHTGHWDIADAALNNVTQDLNAVAYYSVNTYTVTFYNHDRTVLAERNVEYLGAAEAPAETPVRNGYRFTGWNKDFDVVESDLEVTALFEPNLYSIKVYDGNNPANPNAYRIVDNVAFDSLISLETPTYSGYKFAGWYTDNAYVNEWKINEQPLDRYEIRDGVVLTLYAKWIRLYIVNFYDEAGTISVASFEIESGLAFDESSAPALTEKTGYTVAWHLYSAGTVSEAAYVWSTPVTSNIDLIPKYTPIEYTVRFYFPDELYATRTVPYGGKIEDIPEPTYQNGRTFVRWLVDVKELVVDRDYDIRSEYTVAEYDAVWMNGAGGQIAVTKVKHGSSAVFPSSQYELPAKTGYTFVSWQAQGNQDMYNVTGNITLDPVFAKNSYSVKFRNPLTNEVYYQNVYGGTGTTAEQILEYYTFISLDTIVDVPSEVGKDFLGWYVTRGSEKILLGYSSVAGAARWSLYSASAIEGATALSGTLIVTGENYYYTEVSNVEYYLVNDLWRDQVEALVEIDGVWHRVRDASSDPVAIGSGTLTFAGGLFYAVENDLTFESEFTASVYEFTYHTGLYGDDGEETVITERYTHGSVVRAPAIGEKEGSVFIGWYTEEAFVNSYVFGSPATAGATLYARWEAQTLSKGVVYKLNGDGSAYIACGVDENDIPDDGIFVVANYYMNKPVTSVDAGAFSDELRMRGIVLPATLVSIGPNAFMNAVNLVSVEIPESVKTIPDNCFNGCVSLVSVVFPANSSLVSIGAGAFRNCILLNSSMTESSEASFPATLTSIGASAFNGCASFTEIVIPSGVTDIGDNAFFACSALRYAVFTRQTPCNIGANVFVRNGNDYNAFRIYVPDVQTYTAANVSENWKALAAKLYSSANVDDDGEWTYVTGAGNAVLQQYIGNETVVTVPSSIIVNGAAVKVTGLADNVFGSTVTEVALPAGVAISAETFLSATSLTAIALESAGVTVSPEYLSKAYSESATLKTLILRDSSLTLAELFAGSAPVNLKNLILDFNGDMTPSAYANNQYITYVRIGEFVTDVSANAFSGDTALQTVFFAGSLCDEIGDNAFNGCISLTSFRYLTEDNEGLPTAISDVGSDAFTGTPWISAHSDEFVIVGDGILYKYNGSASIITIPAEVKTIAPYAFYANSHIAVVLAEDGSELKTIGEYAFAECASLEAVVIPSRVTLIMENAFYNDAKLATVVVLPGTAPELRGNAFTSTDIITVYSVGAYYNWIAGAINVQVSNIVTDLEAGFVYSNADVSAGGGLLIIKAIDASGTTVIPSQIGNSNVNQIADYALLRSTTELTVDSSLRPVGATDGGKVFAGVTKLTSLTIYYKGGAGGSVGIAESLKSLVDKNTLLTEIRLDGNAPVAELFGSEGALPANIVSVILTGFAAGADNVIADDFLYNCAYVENIYIETENTLIRLEETNEADNVLDATVGANAFRGTAWMDNYSGDFITVLGGNLIDYKGFGAVAEIPEGVERINGGAFATATDITVVFIPASVTDIGDKAFYGATNIVKVFMRGTTAPALGSQPFGSGPEIFIPTGSESAYASSAWASYNKTSVDYAYIINYVRETGDNVFEQIIFDENGGKLLLYRQYTEIYGADGELEGVVDGTEITVTDKVVVEGGDRVVATIGANAFVHTVTSVGVSLRSTLTENAFANITALDKLICYDVAGEPKQAVTLWRIVTDKGIREIEYDGSVTLDELLGTTDGAYARPATLTAITISDGVTETVMELLAGWSGITYVSFPASVEKVGPNSLEDTAWYSNYNSNAVILGGGVLYKYKGTDSIVVIPANVRIINTGAFSTLVWNENAGDWDTYGTLKVSRIRFESGSVATTILDYAFAGCSMLNSITLPSSMKYIADNAFDGTQFTVSDDDDMLIVRGDTGGATLVKYYGSAATVELPTEVKVISASAFEGNAAIVTITYAAAGSLLTTICDNAFFGCVNLENVILPASLASVGRGAFHNTRWLADLINAGTEDATIQSVLYQKIVKSSNSTYTVSASVRSVTPGALEAVSFEIDGVNYSVDPQIGTVELAPGAYISSEELYSLLSTKGVDKFVSDGSRSLSSLIGGREPLSNITKLGFRPETTEIAENYAYGWSNVTVVDTVSSNVKKIGAGAFVGTAWYESKNDEFVINGGILIKYNGDGGSVTVGAPGTTFIRGFTADAFRGNTAITEIIFGEHAADITEIPAEAFLGCTSLVNVVLPANIAVYGENAFAGTPWLTDTAADENGYVVIDGSLIAYVGESSEVVVPQGTEYIYPYVFRNNENIVSVAFDRYSLVSEIEANTFLNCVNLISVTLSESVLYVDRTAFTNTAWLNSNDILYYVDSYNGIKRAVLYVGAGGVVRIPSDVTEIAPDAFRGVTTITGVVFTENTKITEIPAGAFEGCTSLATVTLVSAIKTIGDNAFAGTPYLSALTGEFVVVNGKLVRYGGSATDITLPATVASIDSAAFAGNATITSVDMSATSVTLIPEGAFLNCSALATVILPTSVTYVGENAFAGTALMSAFEASEESYLTLASGDKLLLVAAKKDITDVVVPEGVGYLPAYLFGGNANIVSVTFSAPVTAEAGAFVGCSALQTVNGIEFLTAEGDVFSGTRYAIQAATDGFIVINGVLSSYTGAGGDIVIPAGVEIVKAGVFTGNASITSVSFENIDRDVTIEAEAFRNCVNLDSVTFSSEYDVESVGYRAFYNTCWAKNYPSDILVVNNRALAYFAEGTSVRITADINEIAPGVFAGNKNIATLVFDMRTETVTIPEGAFMNCTSLNSITFPGSNIVIEKDAFYGTSWYTRQSSAYITVNGMLIAYKGSSPDIAIPANVTHIYDYVFGGNDDIVSLSFASSIRLTSLYGTAFAGCGSLTTVNLPASLNYLELTAFEGTPWLSAQGDMIIVGTKLLAYRGAGGAVVIPTSVQSIGEKVFTGNTAITSVSFALGSYVTSIPAEAFMGCTALASVTFPEGILNVGQDAFKGTPWYDSLKEGTGLKDGAYILNGRLLFYKGDATSYTVPAEVNAIADNAFSGTTVKEIVVTSADPGALNPGSGLDGMNIYVPADSLLAYRNHTYWLRYALKLQASAAQGA